MNFPRRNIFVTVRTCAMVAERIVSDKVIEELRGKLTDASTSLPHKYRVLFSLRNIKGEAAREALAAGVLPHLTYIHWTTDTK